LTADGSGSIGPDSVCPGFGDRSIGSGSGGRLRCFSRFFGRIFALPEGREQLFAIHLINHRIVVDPHLIVVIERNFQLAQRIGNLLVRHIHPQIGQFTPNF
jgi:hypothetical protein